MRYPSMDPIVMDPTRGTKVAELVAKHPRLKRLAIPGAAYEVQKNAVCRQSESEFVVFMDGDCAPVHPDWIERILKPFEVPQVSAISGLTIYDDDSLVGKAMSVLDFGFLYVPDRAPLDCYVSNNVAFRRSVLLDTPIPEEGVLRSYCYKHAQLLKRQGKAVRLCSSALMRHELPNVNKERRRRGYDYVSALWADPKLHEAQWLEQDEPKVFLEKILAHNLEWAERRLAVAPDALNLSVSESEQVRQQFQRLLEIDRGGVVEALKEMGKL